MVTVVVMPKISSGNVFLLPTDRSERANSSKLRVNPKRPTPIGVGLFGFTLSFDEFARSLLSVGSKNTLPLEIFGMTTTVTTPTLYALGTLTTAVSFLIIGISFSIIAALERRRRRHGSDAGEGMV